ncbi:MAG TPA: transcriptional regulator [Pyrinomonadaceae bacterium]|nr:transcriptional regulator [Pyrinomonadaceae bacterium]
MPHNLCYEFGPYHLNLNRRVLTFAGETISLTPKATEILVLLVTNAGQLVEKDELLKQVWPDTFVEESNVSQNIFILRRALGDERAGPRYIETVARRGYRFIGSVKAVGADECKADDVPVAEVSWSPQSRADTPMQKRVWKRLLKSRSGVAIRRAPARFY